MWFTFVKNPVKTISATSSRALLSGEDTTGYTPYSAPLKGDAFKTKGDRYAIAFLYCGEDGIRTHDLLTASHKISIVID